MRLTASLLAAALLLPVPLSAQENETPADNAAAKPAKPARPFKAESLDKLIKSFQTTPQKHGVAQVYTQQIAYMIPGGYSPVAEGEDDKRYIVMLTPKGQDNLTWASALQVTGYRNLGLVDGYDATTMAQAMLKPNDAVCTDQWVAVDLGPLTVDSYPAHAVMVGCAKAKGAVSAGNKETGQLAVILTIRALYDMFTVQISFRGKPFDLAKPPADEARARAILARLQPVALCAVSLDVKQCVAHQKELGGLR